MEGATPWLNVAILQHTELTNVIFLMKISEHVQILFFLIYGWTFHKGKARRETTSMAKNSWVHGIHFRQYNNDYCLKDILANVSI